MDMTKTAFHHGLSARIGALEACEGGILERKPEALETVRRLSRSFRGLRDAPDEPEAVKILKALEEIDDEELPARFRSALPRLRELAHGKSPAKTGILLVDDDPLMTEFLQGLLGDSNREIFIARTGAEAEKIVGEKDISLVLLDIMLPDADGRNLLERFRERFEAPSMPIVMLSGKKDPRIQTECFALGADAYFQKPVDPFTLATALASYLQRTADFTRLSSRDPLTGLPNREAFAQAFVRASSLSVRTRAPLAIALLDLDLFKSVNDLHGHGVGDAVLRRTGAVIGRCLRASDFFARWGGDEFALLFSNTDLPSARLTLEKALKILRADVFEAGGAEQNFQISFSAGVAPVEAGASVEQAVAHADRLLFRAKAQGRSRVLAEDDSLMRKRKILLIGGGFSTLEVQGKLELLGMSPLFAEDAGAASSILSRSAASLVVLDLDLPGANAFEFLRSLRGDPALSRIPVLALTNPSSRDEFVRALRAGADDCASKPVAPTELSARVLRLLK